MAKQERSDTFKALDAESKKVGERRDCTVKAWAVVSGQTYAAARQDLSDFGRRPCQAVHMRTLLSFLVRRHGLRLVDETVKFRKLGGKTVAPIGRMLPEQHKYLVFVRGHVLAISGGEVHDWTAGRKHRVNQVLRIEKDS